MAEPLTTDSPLSRRIVRSFLHFLSSVEPGAADAEGIQIARECLQEAFNLNNSDNGGGDLPVEADLLVDLFRSLEKSRVPENVSSLGQGSVTADTSVSAASVSRDQDSTDKNKDLGDSKDDLFGRFFSALEKARYFTPLPDGSDDPVKLEKTSQIFHDALNEMERSGCEEFSPKSLAETLKSQGNKAMQSKLYTKAIELYDCAIALCETNSVYHCNRAAAYTQIHKYDEAIRDCLVSMELDPNYSKAYSRLGSAFYALGCYRDAIDKGFKIALQLDPNNEAVKENMRLAEQKLLEQQRARSHQNTSSFSFSSSSNGSASEHQNQSTGGSRGQGAPPPFGSMPFNTTFGTADFPVFMNMAANAYQGQHSPDSNGDDDSSSNGNGADEPEIRIDGNVSVDFGDIPAELSGALRSVMQMFSGAAANGNAQDTPPNEGPTRPSQT